MAAFAAVWDFKVRTARRVFNQPRAQGDGHLALSLPYALGYHDKGLPCADALWPLLLGKAKDFG